MLPSNNTNNTVYFEERGVLSVGRRHSGGVAAKRSRIRALGTYRRACGGAAGRVAAAVQAALACAAGAPGRRAARAGAPAAGARGAATAAAPAGAAATGVAARFRCTTRQALVLS